ncbi:MAG: hypothetical protein ACJ75R_06195 [Solirubrobacterales bacterium]
MPVRTGLIAAVCALLAAGTSVAAETLSKHDAQDIARDAARKECARTMGCQTYRAFDVNKVSRLRAVGKIEVQAVSSGVGRVCKRKLTMTLHPASGRVERSLGPRHCIALASTS